MKKQINRMTIGVALISSGSIGLYSTSVAETIIDQIGSNDGSGVGTLAEGCQNFEPAYDIYDIATLDNFVGAGESIQTVEMVLGGWNGFVDPSSVSGYTTNIYSSPTAASMNLLGDVDTSYADAAFCTISTKWSGAGFLVNMPTTLNVGFGDFWIAMIPHNDFATGGQTGVHESFLGDGVLAWSANPGGGFGLPGNLLQVSIDVAYRLIGSNCEAGFDCNKNGIDDCIDISEGNAIDCNLNSIPDECDIANGTSDDANGDDIPDECQDCNNNGVHDSEDIQNGTSYDCDQNDVPDECQPDCDGDGLPDPCEPDIDGDGIPDNCETDCNENGWPDEWELVKGYATDCDNNGWLDECDIADGIYEDCDGNGLPDFCDIQDGTHEDCDENDIPDICQSWNDINNNGISDICEVPLATYGGLLLNNCVTNSSGQWFGHNVDIAGDLITISCSSLDDWGVGNQWNIDVYSRDSEGNWAPEFRIDDGDLVDNHISTSLDPPFLASAAFSQSVTIYQRVTELEDPTVCDGKARWDVFSTIDSPEDLEYFGHAVALEGDDLAVAANVGSGGVIELYGRTQEGNWEQTQRLILSDHISWEPKTPRGLEIENGWLVVSWTGQSSSIAGAMVFRKNGKGVYEFHELLDLPIYEDPDFPHDSTGWVTADIDGNRILVEAFDFGDQTREDRCWIFDWNEEAQSWTRSNATFTDGIPVISTGMQSVISGDLVAIAKWYDVGGNVYKAISAYRYTQEGWELFSRVDSTIEGSIVSDPGDQLAFDEFTLVQGSWGFYDANIITFDADNDGVLDVDQVAMNPEIDSDNTGIPDFAEPDCNGNGIADAHDILQDPSLDEQYPNGIIDDCEIDIDDDGFPDWWEAGNDNDYNNNWINDWDEGDCNENGLPDVIEIHTGTLEDNNNDWIPDVCQCLADPSQDGEVGVSDMLIIIATWGETCSIGDTNGDHVIDVTDLLFVVSNWGPCE